MRKSLDPNLASILDSIRATVGGEAPPPEVLREPEPAEPDDQPETAESASAKPAKARRAAAAPTPATPIPAGQRSVEEFLAELIRPQVDAWLKAHLPELIQKMAAEEIARLTGRK
jgi:hypothetical protein